MISTQPGLMPLASFKVISIENVEPHLQYIHSNGFDTIVQLWTPSLVSRTVWFLCIHQLRCSQKHTLFEEILLQSGVQQNEDSATWFLMEVFKDSQCRQF
ncbi:hypothetical protein LSAT2_000372 [Lamellibrachia satsuma]|nr:hypothetical protein LSAT2_000372 [Lamellibrachia satsuma]